MTQTSQPASAFTETPLSRCQFYKSACCLPAVVDPRTGRIAIGAGLIGAVMMPTALARCVKTSLDVRGVAPLSIVGHPRADMWTFLVRADIRPIGDPDEVARLWEARVVVIRDGEIALPSPMPDPLMVRTWVSPATSVFRPSGAVVIECAQSILRRTPR